MRSALLLTLCGAIAFPMFPLAADANDESSSRPEVIASYHQFGASRFASQEKLSKLQEVWQLPQTAALVNEACRRLALSPGQLCPELVPESKSVAVSKLLQPLLMSLLTQESYFDCRATATGAIAWQLGVRPDPSQRTQWQQNLKQIASLLAFQETADAEGPDAGLVRYRKGETELSLRIQAGWLTLGTAQTETTSGPSNPLLPLGEAWLRADLNLAKLAAPMGYSPDLNWPHVELSVFGEGKQQRTEMTLRFAQNATGPIQAWQIPTNTIREPLVSFAAIRGLRTDSWWSKLLGEVGIAPPPNQLFCWAQSDIVAQSFLVFPSSDATNTVRQLPARLSKLVEHLWKPGGMPGRLEWRASEGMAVWKSLPFIVPRVWPLMDQGVSYIAAGLFPPSPRKDPPPQELLDQFRNDDEVIAYAWEYSPVRLAQIRHMSQLAAVLLETPQLSAKQAGIPWTVSIEPLLGNSVTEVHAKSDKEWSLIRRSGIGMTAGELVILTRWLESEAFPRFGLTIESTEPAPGMNAQPPGGPGR